jgi:hypothetical protein
MAQQICGARFFPTLRKQEIIIEAGVSFFTNQQYAHPPSSMAAVSASSNMPGRGVAGFCEGLAAGPGLRRAG